MKIFIVHPIRMSVTMKKIATVHSMFICDCRQRGLFKNLSNMDVYPFFLRLFRSEMGCMVDSLPLCSRGVPRGMGLS